EALVGEVGRCERHAVSLVRQGAIIPICNGRDCGVPAYAPAFVAGPVIHADHVDREAKNMNTFLWHDYETFGTDPRRDRPAQFAAIRTTMDLEPVGEPVVFHCKPAPDVLPHPAACLITGITPQHAERHGVIEAEFAARVHEL